MISKIKNMLIVAAAVFAFAAPAVVPTVAFAEADIQGSLCSGVNLDATNADCDVEGQGQEAATNVSTLLARVINIFSIVVGVIAVIMIIIGGLKYITSGGDSGNVSSAKNTIIYALVGLVIVALAQFIVRFVLGQASGLDG